MKLTILIPVYNQEKWIRTALDSIPIRRDIQVIIIDDASTDKSNDIIQQWFKEYGPTLGSILIKRNSRTMGLGYCKNWAYGRIDSDYLITLNGDDYLHTHEYYGAIEELYNTNDDIIFIDNDINNGEVWTIEDRFTTWCYFVKNQFLIDNNLIYDPDVLDGDYDLMQKINKVQHSKGHIHEVLYHYNYPPENYGD